MDKVTSDHEGKTAFFLDYLTSDHAYTGCYYQSLTPSSHCQAGVLFEVTSEPQSQSTSWCRLPDGDHSFWQVARLSPDALTLVACSSAMSNSAPSNLHS